jgi:Flp pilus assembly CpaE family ATPase
LKYPVSWRLPKHDFNGMASAVNKGVPLSKLLPNSKLGQNLSKMAQQLGSGARPALKRKNAQAGFLKRIIQ